MPTISALFDDLTRNLPSLQIVAFHLLAAFALAKPIAWVYVWTHHGVSYSRAFVQAIVLLAMLVAAVMLAIGDSMARAFGLFGALALIRFRTPIKDSRDTVFLFAAVVVGITVGVQNLPLAVGVTALVLLTAAYMHGIRFGARTGSDAVLRLTVAPAGEQRGLLQQVLAHYCRSTELLSARDLSDAGQLELAYRIRLHERDAADSLVADASRVAGARDVLLTVQRQHEEI